MSLCSLCLPFFPREKEAEQTCDILQERKKERGKERTEVVFFKGEGRKEGGGK